MTTNFWEFPHFQPRLEQDTELLQQIGFLPGLKEFLMLRQVHALEHGTIWLLGKGKDDQTLGGLSTDQGFYLYGQVNLDNLQQAVNQALARFQQGEWDLAIHPRCGTNLSVAVALGTGLALGAHLLLPRDLFSQLLGLGLATHLALQLAPSVGTSTQQYLTTAIPFNLKLNKISLTRDIWGRQAYFVRLDWQESTSPQANLAAPMLPA
ncbi:DUF6391 domain-containing protein [Gloeocapsa sp. PCC 73106]|uniref:DUF6391 domain-containing protein n=1 Tax=Gloeocapsa sp. PCC 73106 TaxID=102232 RepID=UPI0002ACFDAE|nr:DUF6391 domain-containing protein [Gloeocapsa sp. PCC 73106]ELR99322.1 hypothetical protein GLO73106DRAFT_00031720 [Gloeocapsa sp. PCC 73106]